MKRWAQALAIAAALHAAALLVFFLVTRDGATATPVEVTAPRAAQRVTRVTLNGRPQVAAPASVEPTAPGPTSPPRKTGAVVADGPKPDVVAGEPPVDAAAPVGEAVGSSPETVTEPQAPAPAAEGQGGGAGTGAAPAASQPGAPGVDVDGLVHARLSAAAGKCYPAAAKRFRQRGVVEVSFCTDSGGSAVERAVKHSSGFELLDRAAVECVLANASPLPAEASGRCFALPVRFGPQ